jgi:hypothetical protein
MASTMTAQTVLRSASRIDSLGVSAVLPQSGQRSFNSLCGALAVIVDPFRRDAVTLFNVSIMIFLLLLFFTAMESSLFVGGKCGSFTLVSPDIQ